MIEEEYKREIEEKFEKEIQEKEAGFQDSGKFYVSFSKISTYLSCGFKYYYKYVKGIIPPLSVSLFGGLCFHKTVERVLKERKERNYLSLKDARDIYFEISKELLKTRGVIAISDREKREGVKAVLSRNLKAGLKALYIFFNSRVNKIVHDEIKGVEYPVFFDALETAYAFFDEKEIEELKIEENLKDVVVIGYIDYLCKNQLCEIKTTGNFYKNLVERYLNQVSLYSVGFLKEFGFYPESVRLDILVTPENPEEVKYLVGFLKIKEENIERYFRRMNIAVAGIKKGVFLVPNTNYLCKNFCPYKEMGCKYFV